MHLPPLHRAAAVALPVLLWVLAAGAGAGEPAPPAAHVIYLVDYTAHKVKTSSCGHATTGGTAQ